MKKLFIAEKKVIVEKPNWTYIGRWEIVSKLGGTGVVGSVFYDPNPDLEKGHRYYPTIFYDYVYECLKITDGTLTIKTPFSGIEEDGIVYVSKYRHDYVKTPSGLFIDGGRDYIRTNANPKLIKHYRVVNGMEVIEC